MEKIQNSIGVEEVIEKMNNLIISLNAINLNQYMLKSEKNRNNGVAAITEDAHLIFPNGNELWIE